MHILPAAAAANPALPHIMLNARIDHRRLGDLTQNLILELRRHHRLLLDHLPPGEIQRHPRRQPAGMLLGRHFLLQLPQLLSLRIAQPHRIRFKVIRFVVDHRRPPHALPIELQQFVAHRHRLLPALGPLLLLQTALQRFALLRRRLDQRQFGFAADELTAEQTRSASLLLAHDSAAAQAIVDQLMLGCLTVAVMAALQQDDVAHLAIAGVEIDELGLLLGCAGRYFAGGWIGWRLGCGWVAGRRCCGVGLVFVVGLYGIHEQY